MQQTVLAGGAGLVHTGHTMVATANTHAFMLDLPRRHAAPTAHPVQGSLKQDQHSFPRLLQYDTLEQALPSANRSPVIR